MDPSFAPLSLKITAQHVGRIINSVWGRLTKPASSIQEPERRRQAQLLSSLLLLVLIIVLVAPIRATAGILWQDFSTPVSIVVIVTVVGVYGLSRTKHYGTSATMTIAILFALIHLAPFFVDRGEQVLFYAVLPILLSSLLFSLRAVFGVAITSIGTMLLLISLVPQAEINTYTAPVIYTLVISAALVTFIHQRDLLASDEQEVLRKSESECRLLLEHASDGISVADRKGNYLKVNSTLCQVLGYPREEFLQLNVRDIIPPEDLASAPLRFDELYAGKVVLIERRLRRKDGTLLPVEISAKMLDDGRLQAIVRDIGERKQVEEALRESQTFLEKAQEVGHIGSWKSEMAMAGALTWSKEIYRIFGIAEDQFDGKVETFFNYIYPDDLEAVKAASQAAFANDVPYNIEHRIVRPDGSVRWVHERADVLRDETGAPLQMIGTIQDITERKQAEEVTAKRAVELEAVAKVNTTAATMLKVNQLLQTVVDLTKFSFKLYHAHIYLLDNPPTLDEESHGQTLVLASGAGEVGQKMVAHGWQIPLDREQSLVARAARTRQGVIVNDVQVDPSFLPNPLLPETRSEMAVPMIMGEQLLGVFDVQSDGVNRFTDEDIHIQTILAAQVAVALQNARQYEQAQTALAEQRRLAAELDNQRRTLEAILHNMPAGVFVAEAPSGKLLLTNERAEAILGRDITLAIATTKDELAEVDGAYLYGSDELYPTSHMPLVQGMSGTTTRVDNMEIRRPDGQRILLEVAGAPIRDAQGQITASVAIFQDITERKRAEEALRRYTERLKDLRAIDQAILAASSLEAIAESAIAHIRRLVPCLKASLTLFDLEAGTFMALAVHMNGDTKIKPGISFPLATSMMKRLVQGQVEVVEDILSLSPLPEPLQHLQAEGIRSYIAVPLIAQSELIGSLNLLASRPRAFSEQDIEIASEVADQLALAIKHAHLHEQVQRHAAELEQRIIERTAQLEATNKVLENEIAERKQAENTLAAERNLLRTLIDNLPDYIYVKDTESRFMTSNMAHMHLMGATRLGEIVGKTDFDLFPAKLARQYYADDQAVIHSCQPLFNREELTISETDDSLKWVSTTKVPLWDSQGKVMGLVGITRDISQRKQAEEAIKQLNEDLNQRAIQLEAANKELEAFSYSVSHDLRAPLRAIDGFSQALLEDYAEQLDEAGQDHLQRVRAATQRMGQLIDDMLDLSRITRSELRRQQVNLSALAAMIAWELRQTQLERQVEFVIAPGVTAESDPQLLRVALENLLSNAWKFTQKQSQATIEFGVTQHQGQLTYFVRDDGVGFDMAYADKLFGPFQRLHARNEFEGTGIGLATVQRIIQRHGGRVWAEATVGKGATFFFTLL